MPERTKFNLETSTRPNLFDYFPSQQHICRITALVVTEASRGLGVGTQLIDFAKSRASERGCRQLEVTTSMRREQTQTYYESIGFEKTSFRYIQALEVNPK